MPIFNSGGKSQTGLTIADDDIIIDFLNPENAKYVDARTALHNSDIYSVIFQLSLSLIHI